LTAMPWSKVQPLIFSLAVNAAGCLVLVPRYGLLGATFSRLGAPLGQSVLALAIHGRCPRQSGETKAATPASPGGP
jgi:O-antigen/teichoic acid export membrane protein